MRQAEIETWSRWALPARVAQAERCARIAGDGWRRRMRDARETRDAMTFCRGGMLACEAAAHAAATVPHQTVLASRIVVQDEHVVLAWGRDYGDISPVRGVILGGGHHTVVAGVDLEAV